MNDNFTESIFEIYELKEAMLGHGRRPIERLEGLASALSQLGKSAPDKNKFRDSIDLIQQKDLDYLKRLITPEVKKAGIPHHALVAEQILMVLIGTLQMEARNEKSVSWNVATSAIKALLQNSQRSLILRYAMPMVGIMMLGVGGLIGYQLFLIPTIPLKEIQMEPLAIAPENAQIPSPYVPSHFYTIRRDMEEMKCQFPQAMMLPEAQRSAFLGFINTGEIALSELTNLQMALSKVNCAYKPLTSHTGH